MAESEATIVSQENPSEFESGNCPPPTHQRVCVSLSPSLLCSRRVCDVDDRPLFLVMALLRSGSVAATPVAGGMLLVRITSSPKFSSCLARTSIHSLGSEASSFPFSSAALFTGASGKLFGASVSSSSKPVAVTRIVASRGRRAAGLGLLSFAVGVNLSSRASAAEVAKKSVYDHIVKAFHSVFAFPFRFTFVQRCNSRLIDQERVLKKVQKQAMLVKLVTSYIACCFYSIFLQF